MSKENKLHYLVKKKHYTGRGEVEGTKRISWQRTLRRSWSMRRSHRMTSSNQPMAWDHDTSSWNEYIGRSLRDELMVRVHGRRSSNNFKRQVHGASSWGDFLGRLNGQVHEMSSRAYFSGRVHGKSSWDECMARVNGKHLGWVHREFVPGASPWEEILCRVPWDVFLEGVYRRKSLDDLAERRLWNLSGEVPVLTAVTSLGSDVIVCMFWSKSNNEGT